MQHAGTHYGVLESPRGYRVGYCVLTHGEVQALTTPTPTAEAVYEAFTRSTNGFWLFDKMGQSARA